MLIPKKPSEDDKSVSLSLVGSMAPDLFQKPLLGPNFRLTGQNRSPEDIFSGLSTTFFTATSAAAHSEGQHGAMERFSRALLASKRATRSPNVHSLVVANAQSRLLWDDPTVEGDLASPGSSATK